MLDFPSNPINGQTYTGPNGVIWVWDTQKWVNGTQIGTAYAPINSPVLTGNPTAPNPPVGDADTSLATTQFVAAATGTALTNVGRNLIHNPLFAIAQRGAIAVTTVAYTAMDRWYLYFNLDTVSVQSIAYNDAQRAQIGDEAIAVGLMSTFTGNAGAASETIVLQRIESVRRLAGKTVTASFWAHASVAGVKLGVSFDQSMGTGGSPSVGTTGNGQSVTLTTTPVRYSLTFTLPSIAGKTLGTAGNDFTGLDFWFSCGTTDSARSGNIGVQSGIVVIGGVQLEVGSVMTPLDYGGSPAQQLQQCQRFYQVITGLAYNGYSASGTTITFWWPLIVAMRANPTLSVVWGTNTNIIPGLYTSGTGLYVSAASTATGQFGINLNSATASADL
jgi:hypothetical protein